METKTDLSSPGRAQVFTKAEEQAIAQLKSLLPEILLKATEGSENPTNNQMWNVPLDPASNDRRLDVILVKFLRARNLDVEKAKLMLTNTIRWRADFRADTILNESFPQDIFAGVGLLHKTDNEGRPVCYNIYGGLDVDKVFGNLERFLRWRVQLMERGIQLLDFVDLADMIQVHDYNGVSMFSNNKVSKAASKATIQIMQDNYPEFLAAKFFVNVPSWGAMVFKFVRLFLSESTARKFVVCTASELPKAFERWIDINNIPKQYGGKSEMIVPKRPEEQIRPADSTISSAPSESVGLSTDASFSSTAPSEYSHHQSSSSEQILKVDPTVSDKERGKEKATESLNDLD